MNKLDRNTPALNLSSGPVKLFLRMAKVLGRAIEELMQKWEELL